MSPKPVNILLVDDTPANHLAMEAVLERLGENMVRAYSGVEAIKLFQSMDFAVILMDVQMPVMDGLEAAARIRESEQGANTPIIFITAADLSDTLVKRAYTEGAVDFLFKPYAPEILRSKVKVFVDLFRSSRRLQTSLRELEDAEKLVREINSDLEKRVESRTLELQEALKRAEASEQRYRYLAEFVPTMVWTADPQGIPNYSNQIWNDYTNKPLGNGTEWLHVTHPEDAGTFAATWREAIAAEEPFETEVRLLRRDGRYRLHIVRGAPLLSAENVITVWLGTCMDIEERHQVQAALKSANTVLQEARDKAIEASNAKSLFLANISHEFRTPLNAIIGYTEMLGEELGELDLPDLQADVERIRASGRHLMAIIEDVLDLAIIESGKMTLRLSEVELEPLLRDMVHSIRSLTNPSHNTLNIETSEDLGSIIVDEVKLRQILLNLLTNAMKFTNQGTIRLTGRRIVVNDEDHVEIEVSDTGIGIAEDQQDKLFKDFSQADSTATREYGGTGLGLALSKRFATLMCGTIRVNSTLGQGSVFTLVLPAVQPNEDEPCSQEEYNR